MRKIPIDELVKDPMFGSRAGLARALTKGGYKVSDKAIYQWDDYPTDRAIQIEEISRGKYPRERLRPDYFRSAKR